MVKYKSSDYTRSGKHGKGRAVNSYPALRITFDGRAVNRDCSVKYKKKERRNLKQGIDKRRSRINLSQSAVRTRTNRRRRHSSDSHNREQGTSRKRIRSSSSSPRRASPEQRIYSDISECDLLSNPGGISDDHQSILYQRSTINEDHRQEKTYSHGQTSAHGQKGEMVDGKIIYSRISSFNTERRCDDMYSFVSSGTHDVRSPKTEVYTEGTFPLPITFQSFDAFSSHEKTEFISTALAELVALKTENDEYVFGVKMPDFRDRLYSRGIQFESYKSYNEVMSSLLGNFDITHDKMIQPRTDVKICESYTQNPMLNDCDCHDLHICKFYLVGKCMSDQSCKFSHEIFQHHNKNVLKRHFLHKMKPVHIGEIVSYVHNRNAATSPTVCKFYNNEGDCKQKQRCQHLHVCLHFVTKTCKFGTNCKRDHDFHSDQSKPILIKYGLSEYEYNLEVLFDLIGKNLNNGEIKTRKSLDSKINRKYDKCVDGTQCASRNTQELKGVSETPDRYFHLPKNDDEKGKTKKNGKKLTTNSTPPTSRTLDRNLNLQLNDQEGTKAKESGTKLTKKQGIKKKTSVKGFCHAKNIVETQTGPADISGEPIGNSNVLQTQIARENDSEEQIPLTTDDLDKQLDTAFKNNQETTIGRIENKAPDTILYVDKSNINEYTTKDHDDKLPKAIGNFKETPTLMDIVDKGDDILDIRQGNLQPEHLRLDGKKTYDNRPPFHLEPSGYDDLEKDKKQFLCTSKYDKYFLEKTEQISEGTKPDRKITFQLNPNHNDDSNEQDNSTESAEEGEIIEDAHSQYCEVPDQTKYFRLQGEAKHGTSATVILTYGNTRFDSSERPKECNDNNNLNKEPCIMVGASIGNVHRNNVLDPPFGNNKKGFRQKKLSGQCSSEQQQQTDTINRKRNGIAEQTYRILVEGDDVDISIVGETDKVMLNDDITNKVKTVITSLIQIGQQLDNTGHTDQIVSNGGNKVDN